MEDSPGKPPVSGPSNPGPVKSPDGPAGPGPEPDGGTIDTGPSGPWDPFGMTRTGGDPDDPFGRDIFDLDADPDDGGEISFAARSSSDPEEGGEFAPQPGGPIPIPYPVTEDPDAGGEVAFARFDGVDGESTTKDHTGIGLKEDPDAGGEVFARGQAGGRTTVHDSHDRAASLLDETTPDDGHGDIVEDPDGGGPVAMDPLHLLAQVNHLASQDAGKSLEEIADDTPPPPPPPPPTPPPARQISEDPDAGGEVVMPPRPVTMTADDLRSSDPEEGGEVVPDFGAGAMPPRPVTMTAEDLQSSDPEEGGEIYEDPDAGGEIFLPIAAVGGEDVFVVTPTTLDEADFATPEPELTDFEVAADFDQASHTLAPEQG